MDHVTIVAVALMPCALFGVLCSVAPHWMLVTLWRMCLVSALAALSVITYVCGWLWALGTVCYIVAALLSVRYLLIRPRVIEQFKKQYAIEREKILANSEG